MIGPDTRFCPNCGSDWRGEEIPEKDRHYFGGKTHFSRLIGVEIENGYDGVSFWRCPDCEHEWDRWTGERVTV